MVPTEDRRSLNEEPIRVQRRETKRIREKEMAVIGLSVRFPLADDQEQFWQNLKSGKDCITAVPEGGAMGLWGLLRIGTD